MKPSRDTRETEQRISAWAKQRRYKSSKAAPCPRVVAGLRCLAYHQERTCICERWRHRIFDHVNMWRDHLGRAVLTSEPYGVDGEALKNYRDDIAAIGLEAAQEDYSPYYPGHTIMIVTRRTSHADACDRLLEARSKDKGLLHAELYCSNSDCPVREITVRFKDYDDTLIEMYRKNGWTCPLCRSSCKLHWAVPDSTYHANQQRQARESVNAQMWSRDRPDPSGLIIMSLDKMADDRLPPTPSDWWTK